MEIDFTLITLDELRLHGPGAKFSASIPRHEFHVNKMFLNKMSELLQEAAFWSKKCCLAYGLERKIISVTDKSEITVKREGEAEIERFIPSGHKRSIKRITLWHGDGPMYILTASTDGTCRVFDYETSKYLREMKGHQGHVLCIAASIEKDVKKAIVASGGADCTVRLHFLSSGRQRYCLLGHTSPVIAVCFSDPNITHGGESVLASMDQLGEIRFWEVDSGRCLRVLPKRTQL